MSSNGNISMGDRAHVGGSIIGGGNNGPIYVGGGAVPPQPYQRKWVRLLPITERGVNLSAAVLALSMFFSGYQSFRTMPLPWASGSSSQTTHGLPAWVYAMLLSAVLFAIAMRWSSLIRHRTQTASRLWIVPSLAGATDEQGRGRLALVANSASCHINGCNGKMRFYAKEDQQRPVYDRKTGQFLRFERRLCAECTKNPRNHFAWLDETDTRDLQGH